MATIDDTDICCLCGRQSTTENPITREHVPPKQFFPKSIRQGLNLWVVPTCKRCNESYKSDEEYFYHALCALVGNANPQMAGVIFQDLRRRAKNPQTPKLIRSVLRSSRTTTEGGIILPTGVVSLDLDQYRIEQVAIKIARCLFYRDHERVMPYANCKDIRICERDEDVPDLYQVSWEFTKVGIEESAPVADNGFVILDPEAGSAATTCRQVFSYRAGYFDDLHLYSMYFWESLMFCAAFTDACHEGNQPT